MKITKEILTNVVKLLTERPNRYAGSCSALHDAIMMADRGYTETSQAFRMCYIVDKYWDEAQSFMRKKRHLAVEHFGATYETVYWWETHGTKPRIEFFNYLISKSHYDV